jgi:hypothetical protein
MVEQPARVYEVKATLRRAIDRDVMFYGLKVGPVHILEQLGVDVSGNNAAARPDLLTQPSCHGTAPGRHFQASQSVVNSERCHSPFRHRIKVLLK